MVRSASEFQSFNRSSASGSLVTEAIYLQDRQSNPLSIAQARTGLLSPGLIVLLSMTADYFQSLKREPFFCHIVPAKCEISHYYAFQSLKREPVSCHC